MNSFTRNKVNLHTVLGILVQQEKNSPLLFWRTVWLHLSIFKIYLPHLTWPWTAFLWEHSPDFIVFASFNAFWRLLQSSHLWSFLYKSGQKKPRGASKRCSNLHRVNIHMSLQVIINRNKKIISLLNTRFSLQRATKCHYIFHHTSESWVEYFWNILHTSTYFFSFFQYTSTDKLPKSEELLKVTIFSAYFSLAQILLLGYY